MLHDGPHDTPVGRLDEVRAARQPDLRWRPARRAASSRPPRAGAPAARRPAFSPPRPTGRPRRPPRGLSCARPSPSGSPVLPASPRGGGGRGPPHPKHGWQFQAIDYRTALPATLQGMKKYLGSGLVKGIGPVNAGRIVDAFGEATFEVIDDDPSRLTEVPGIGPVRAERIAATWAEQRHIREVMAALQGYGISTSLAVRIYKRFGDDSGRVITQEPYRLAREVWGIGFKTADKIAQAVGIAPTPPSGSRPGCCTPSAQAADEGHTLLPEAGPGARRRPAGGRGARHRRGRRALLAATGDAGGGHAGRATSPAARALAPFARAESGLASRLQALQQRRPADARGRDLRRIDWAVAFGWLAERHGLTLAPEQEAAVRMALTAPGLDPDRRARDRQDPHPAGRPDAGPGQGAALPARRPDRAGGQADGGGDRPGRPARCTASWSCAPAARPGATARHPLEADLVVVDEVSMLDALLANQLVKACRRAPTCCSSATPTSSPASAPATSGRPLRSGPGGSPVTRLRAHLPPGRRLRDRPQRPADQRRARCPASAARVPDCFFLPAETRPRRPALVVDLVARRLPARYGFGPGEVQVLSPMHRGEAGVGALNPLLQERLNPARTGCPRRAAAGAPTARATACCSSRTTTT